jgi:hypothetical protein
MNISFFHDEFRYDLQSPSGSASDNSVWNTLSALPDALSNLLVGFFCFCVSCSVGANRVSTPGSVGKKNGACSIGFGGSFGLLRCCITSRFRSVCHFVRGSNVIVMSSPSSCGGVEKTSGGVSCAVRASKTSRAKGVIKRWYLRYSYVKLTIIFGGALHGWQGYILNVLLSDSLERNLRILRTVRPSMIPLESDTRLATNTYHR